MKTAQFSRGDIYAWLADATFGDIYRKIEKLEREAKDIYDRMAIEEIYTLKGFKVTADVIAAVAARRRGLLWEGVQRAAETLSLTLAGWISELEVERDKE